MVASSRGASTYHSHLVCTNKWQKPSQQITAIHLSRQPTSSGNDRISLQGHPSVISACCSPDGSLYAASTLDGHVSIWNGDRTLLWETNILSIPSISSDFQSRNSFCPLQMVLPLSWNCWMGNRRTRKPLLVDLNLMRAPFINPRAYPMTQFPGSHLISTQVCGPMLTAVSSASRAKKDPSPLSISRISVD
jgi:hypothetical protein